MKFQSIGGKEKTQGGKKQITYKECESNGQQTFPQPYWMLKDNGIISSRFREFFNFIKV